jgi:hypothetical protein
MAFEDTEPVAIDASQTSGEEITMSANYEWQKLQTNEKIRARLQEAELHRAVKSKRSGGGFFLVRFIKALLASNAVKSPREASEEKVGFA